MKITARSDGRPCQPVNAIVRVDTHGALDSGTVLASGHDFYSSPRLSPDGRWLAFLAWDHPNMPWMGTGLYVLPLNNPDAAPLLVAGGERESVFQPEWAPDGSALYFISDRSGWWNLYRQKSRSPIEPLAVMEAEFGQPQWVFGMSTYAFAGSDRLVCSYVSKGLGQLASIDLASGEMKPLDAPWTDFSSIRANKERVVFRAGSSTAPAGICMLTLGFGQNRNPEAIDQRGRRSRADKIFLQCGGCRISHRAGPDRVRPLLSRHSIPITSRLRATGHRWS